MDRILREPAEILDTPVKSSFPSLRDTFMHIRNAECAWHARVSGGVQRWPAEEDCGPDTFIKHVTVMRDYVRTLVLADLVEVVGYTDLKGNEHKQPRVQALMHCFNHSSYHRGQIVTMMRGLDLPDIPPLDLIVFQRLIEKSGS